MPLVPLRPPGYKASGQLYRAPAILARKSGEELGLFPSRSGVWNERPPFPNQSVYSSTFGFYRYWPGLWHPVKAANGPWALSIMICFLEKNREEKRHSHSWAGHRVSGFVQRHSWRERLKEKRKETALVCKNQSVQSEQAWWGDWSGKEKRF